MTGGMHYKCIPPVIQTSVNFPIFNLHLLSGYYTWNAETNVTMFFLVLVHVLNFTYFNLFEFSSAISEKGLLNWYLL